MREWVNLCKYILVKRAIKRNRLKLEAADRLGIKRTYLSKLEREFEEYFADSSFLLEEKKDDNAS